MQLNAAELNQHITHNPSHTHPCRSLCWSLFLSYLLFVHFPRFSFCFSLILQGQRYTPTIQNRKQKFTGCWTCSWEANSHSKGNYPGPHKPAFRQQIKGTLTSTKPPWAFGACWQKNKSWKRKGKKGKERGKQEKKSQTAQVNWRSQRDNTALPLVFALIKVTPLMDTEESPSTPLFGPLLSPSPIPWDTCSTLPHSTFTTLSNTASPLSLQQPLSLSSILVSFSSTGLDRKEQVWN